MLIYMTKSESFFPTYADTFRQSGKGNISHKYSYIGAVRLLQLKNKNSSLTFLINILKKFHRTLNNNI